MEVLLENYIHYLTEPVYDDFGREKKTCCCTYPFYRISYLICFICTFLIGMLCLVTYICVATKLIPNWTDGLAIGFIWNEILIVLVIFFILCIRIRYDKGCTCEIFKTSDFFYFVFSFVLVSIGILATSLFNIFDEKLTIARSIIYGQFVMIGCTIMLCVVLLIHKKFRSNNQSSPNSNSALENLV